MSGFNENAIRFKHGLTPHWDENRREFRFGDAVVKRYKWPAKNQLRILLAFQEQNWPRMISDPLPVDEGICPKTRLHDTIKCLNRHHIVPVVRFHGDGTGTAVCWSVVEEHVPKVQPAREASSTNTATSNFGQSKTATDLTSPYDPKHRQSLDREK